MDEIGSYVGNINTNKNILHANTDLSPSDVHKFGYLDRNAPPFVLVSPIGNPRSTLEMENTENLDDLLW